MKIFNLIAAAAQVPASTGYAIFAVSLVALVGILRYLSKSDF